MPPSKFTYSLPHDASSSVLREDGIDSGFISTLQGLKYEYRPDTTNRFTFGKNFREKFEALKLMIMRPYQVYAVQHMVKSIDDESGNGFVWHTTGSVKTLTSSKASRQTAESKISNSCFFATKARSTLFVATSVIYWQN